MQNEVERGDRNNFTTRLPILLQLIWASRMPPEYIIFSSPLLWRCIHICTDRPDSKACMEGLQTSPMSVPFLQISMSIVHHVLYNRCVLRCVHCPCKGWANVWLALSITQLAVLIDVSTSEHTSNWYQHHYVFGPMLWLYPYQH